jgi:hypothetical protein
MDGYSVVITGKLKKTIRNCGLATTTDKWKPAVWFSDLYIVSSNFGIIK